MLTVHLIFADRNDQARQAALEGVARAFDQARVENASCVDEVLLKTKPHAHALLILVEPDLAEIELAIKSTLDDGTERWPVVGLGGTAHSTGLQIIGAEDWHAALLAQVFRAAVQKHELVVENARMRGDLLTIARRISHDLRTPLSGIFTTAELLKEILEEHGEDPLMTSPLFTSTQDVMKIIDRVSQMTKAGLDRKLKEDVDMGQIVWAARQGAEKTAMESGTRMSEAETWPKIQGVTAWLEVIWGNLLLNAVKHGGKGRTVLAGWRDGENEIEFSVEDDGPSVKPEKQGGLWQPFQRLHLSHSAHGLGLPIARRLVELQGGRCGYEAGDDGVGNRFFFTLPKEGIV